MVDIPGTAEAEEIDYKSHDASNPDHVRAARKKVARATRARLDFIEGMMTLPQGRKWLFDLLESCFIHGNPVVQNDTHATYFNLGQQNIGKLVLQDVQKFPEFYVQMMQEGKSSQT